MKNEPVIVLSLNRKKVPEVKKRVIGFRVYKKKQSFPKENHIPTND